MKANTFDDLFYHLRVYFQKESFRGKRQMKLLRYVLNYIRKNRCVNTLNRWLLFHRLDYDKAPEQLLKRLSENEEVLIRFRNCCRMQ